uniref:T cell receptor alpha variable 36/delta variable 7 n=1 Tax=Callithrix jacchus TaxID=9483 RepID=A0A8I3WMZ7_CALJA
MMKCPQASLVIFWLQLSWVSSEDKVIQSPPSLVVHEEDSVTVNCSYEAANFQSLLWYKQEKKALTFLFMLTSSRIEKKSGSLSSMLDKKERFSILNITATKTRDSATYLCAVEAQCSLVTCSLYSNSTAESLQP